MDRAPGAGRRPRRRRSRLSDAVPVGERSRCGGKPAVLPTPRARLVDLRRRWPNEGHENKARREPMRPLIGCIRVLVGTLALLVVLAMAPPAAAQQPTSVNPTASSVNEDQLLQQLRRIEGRGTIPHTKSYVLEQPA